MQLWVPEQKWDKCVENVKKKDKAGYPLKKLITVSLEHDKWDKDVELEINQSTSVSWKLHSLDIKASFLFITGG